MGDEFHVIIILGCPPTNHQGEVSKTFLSRVQKGAEVYLAKAGRKRCIIPTGYRRIGSQVSEATAIQTLLIEQGIEPCDIKLEEHARSTVENAIKCREMISNLYIYLHISEISIVTSAFHIPRAKYIFSKLYQGSTIPMHFHESEDCLSGKEEEVKTLAKEGYCLERLMTKKHRVFEGALSNNTSEIWKKSNK